MRATANASCVCLDEAQAMPLETLEALRLLTNLETEKRKLLQVVLFGQPELDEKLDQESVRQLRQRITFQYQLSALRRDEVDYYLAHRLRVAGYMGQRLFTPRAVRTLYRATKGVPRLINIVAHKALLLVYGEGGHEVLAAPCADGSQGYACSPSARTLWWWSMVPTAAAAAASAWLLMR